MRGGRALVLLSGGLDSATCLAIAKEAGYSCFALTISYGQRHLAEIEAARRVAQKIGVEEHKFYDLPLTEFGGSALTDRHIAVPTEMAAGIPVTYVPARNTLFLSVALAWSEVLEASHLFIGVNAVDYSGYPDCRPEFVDAFQRVANLGTKRGVEGNAVKIETPLIDLTKGEIIRLGQRLGLDYRITVSCYQADAEGHACGKCDSCRLRRQGFHDAGILDATRYQP